MFSNLVYYSKSRGNDLINKRTMNSLTHIRNIILIFLLFITGVSTSFCEIYSPAKYVSGTLPVMYINVYTDEKHSSYNNEIIDYFLSHKDYFDYAEYWIDLNGCKWMAEEGAESVGSEQAPLKLQIKARGNWTRIGFSKKPFKLKLDKKQNLLGLTPDKSKHYALLAHADDNFGFLRNYTGFNLGERIGLPWTPAMQPVELVINGDYRGLYFLTESIRVGDGRINIAELDDNETNPDLITGGYIVELDNYDEENQIRMEEKSCVDNQKLDVLRITWDTPEQYSSAQKKYITEQFNRINSAIGNNSNDTWNYLDIDDAARYYLVQEIVSDNESFHGSTYLFKDRGENEKWHFSPLWDMGNAFHGRTNDFFYNGDPFGNTWIPSMRENEKFNEKVRQTWLWFMQNEYPGIEDDIATYVSHIKQAANSDWQRWNNQPVPGGGQEVADNRDMSYRMNSVLKHLREKTGWLKTVFGDYNNGVYSEPEREDSKETGNEDHEESTGNVNVPVLEDNNAGKVIYYNLQGIQVKTPRKGEIYIIREGEKTYKAIFR